MVMEIEEAVAILRALKKAVLNLTVCVPANHEKEKEALAEKVSSNYKTLLHSVKRLCKVDTSEKSTGKIGVSENHKLYLKATEVKAESSLHTSHFFQLPLARDFVEKCIPVVRDGQDAVVRAIQGE